MVSNIFFLCRFSMTFPAAIDDVTVSIYINVKIRQTFRLYICQFVTCQLYFSERKKDARPQMEKAYYSDMLHAMNKQYLKAVN